MQKSTMFFGIAALVAAAAIALAGCPTDGGGDNNGGGGTTTFTVTFDSNGGSAVAAQSVASGGAATEPKDPTKAAAATALAEGLYLDSALSALPAQSTFAGWQLNGAAYNFATPVTASITLTAKWTEPTAAAIDLSSYAAQPNIIAKVKAYIDAQPAATAAYTLVLENNVSNVATITFGKADTTLTITSNDSTEVKISKGSASSQVFIVGGTSSSAVSNAKLVIDGHITLEGKSGNTTAVVNVQYGGSLELKGYAKVTGNTNSGTSNLYTGGGINGYGDYNAGQSVSITLSGNAEVSGNTLSANSSNDTRGGGVIIVYGTLTMNDNAAIKGNTVENTGTGAAQGGGAFISGGGIFTMNGGEISGNTLKYTSFGTGGGVSVAQTATNFVMKGTALVTPTAGGTITGTANKTDNRNSVYLAVSKYIGIDGTLSAAPAALVDLISTHSGDNILRNWNGSSAVNYTSNAPTGKFTLGKFIDTTTSAVTDIGDTKKWADSGNGSLADK